MIANKRHDEKAVDPSLEPKDGILPRVDSDRSEPFKNTEFHEVWREAFILWQRNSLEIKIKSNSKTKCDTKESA